MSAIRKLLIANRGEIALRIMRSAREMGIRTVAVFSEADRAAPHVRYADEAVCVGPPPSAQSYLQMDVIIAAAQATGADAIHPGYGFLSENAAFARKVREAGLIFVGPSAESIEMMGSKIAAKQAARRMNLPLVPGGDEAITARNAAKGLANVLELDQGFGGGWHDLRGLHVSFPAPTCDRARQTPPRQSAPGR